MLHKLPSDLGDVDAKNDELLKDAFIKTASYTLVLDDRHGIIHGRKGIGKSALVEMLPSLEQNNPRWSDIFAAKSPPIQFSDLEQDFKSHAVLSGLGYSGFFSQMWEHFIYDTCMKLILKRYRNKPIIGDLEVMHNYLRSTNQLDEDSVTSVFTFMTTLVSSIEPTFSVGPTKLKVASIGALRTYFQTHHNYGGAVAALHNFMSSHEERILFLIDDIDVDVRSTSPRPIVADFFESLISVTTDVISPHMREHQKLPSRIHVKTFLPTDIFSWLKLRHRDKVSGRVAEISWTSEELTKMFCERLRQRCRAGKMPYDEVLKKYFLEKIYDEYGRPRPVIPYILDNTFYRPRDVLNLYSELHKVLKPDTKITETELCEAISKYISSLVDYVLDEYHFVEPDLKDIIEKFAGEPVVYSYNEAYLRVCSKSKGSVDTKKAADYIRSLWEMGFFGIVKKRPSILGQETELYGLSVGYHYQERNLTLNRAQTLVIHPVFRHQLGLVNNAKEYFGRA